MDIAGVDVEIDVIRELPELEDLEVNPSTEDQSFNSSKYGFKNVIIKGIKGEELDLNPGTTEQNVEGVFTKVKVNAIKTQKLNTVPSTQEQVITGLFDEVTVNAIEGQELNLNPSEKQQNYEGVFLGVNINPIQVQEITTDLDFSSGDAIELKAQEGAYIKKATISKPTNLKPENIKSGETVCGIDGTNADTSDADATSDDIVAGKSAYVANEKVLGTYKPLDTSDATATADDIAKDKTAYVNGEKITGVLEISGGDETSFMSAIDSSLGANVTHLPDGTTSLRTNIFQNCTNLALTKIPDSITTIGDYAFQNCTNLALTKLPPKISNLGAYCFQNCSNLLISEFPTTQNISFGAYAFAGCSNITIKELGPNLGLNTDCFYQCLGITEITHRAPNLPVRIFSGCKNLKKFILPDVTSVIRLGNTNVFASTALKSEDGGIYVPDNLVEDYKVATNWSKWADYIKGLSELEV